MNFKGTKGKWFVSNGIETIDINCQTIPAGIDGIAKIQNQFKSEVSSANALLISKAPEMLEFAQFVAKSMPDGSSLQEKALRLIKSATEI